MSNLQVLHEKYEPRTGRPRALCAWSDCTNTRMDDRFFCRACVSRLDKVSRGRTAPGPEMLRLTIVDGFRPEEPSEPLVAPEVPPSREYNGPRFDRQDIDGEGCLLGSSKMFAKFFVYTFLALTAAYWAWRGVHVVSAVWNGGQ